MPQMQAIRSYLVGLGFSIDEISARRFEDALKRGGAVVQKYAKEAAIGFGVVGGAFATAAAAVVAGTTAMGLSVANQDLQYQLLARRMFMTTDAVRKMDMATKSLGVTLPEIIFGPPELQERYRTLIKDETAMLAMLGGDQGESAFRKIRDIEFQFTRMGPALQIFAMRLTEDVMNKLFGGSESLEERLKSFVDWFESPQGFVRISKEFSDVLAPAISKVGSALGWVWDQAKALTGNAIPSRSSGFSNPMLYPSNQYLLAPTGSADSVLGLGVSALKKQFLDNTSDSERIKAWKQLWAGGKAAFQQTPDWIISHIQGAGTTPEEKLMLLALADQETGGQFNLDARNPRTGAFGLGQVLPQNWPSDKDPTSGQDQIDVMRSIMRQNLARRKGNVKDALHDYYGWGTPGPGEPTFDEYYNSWQKKYNKWKSGGWGDSGLFGGFFDPTSARGSSAGGTGPITINISQPNATPDQIKRAVREGITEHQREQAAQMFNAAPRVYA